MADPPNENTSIQVRHGILFKIAKYLISFPVILSVTGSFFFLSFVFTFIGEGSEPFSDLKSFFDAYISWFTAFRLIATLFLSIFVGSIFAGYGYFVVYKNLTIGKRIGFLAFPLLFLVLYFLFPQILDFLIYAKKPNVHTLYSEGAESGFGLGLILAPILVFSIGSWLFLLTNLPAILARFFSPASKKFIFLIAAFSSLILLIFIMLIFWINNPIFGEREEKDEKVFHHRYPDFKLYPAPYLPGRVKKYVYGVYPPSVKEIIDCNKGGTLIIQQYLQKDFNLTPFSVYRVVSNVTSGVQLTPDTTYVTSLNAGERKVTIVADASCFVDVPRLVIGEIASSILTDGIGTSGYLGNTMLFGEWKKYVNSKWGYKFDYPASFDNFKEQGGEIAFGIGERTYLSVSSQITNYDNLPFCSWVLTTPKGMPKETPCFIGQASDIELDAVPAKSFYISYGLDDYHLITTKVAPFIQLKMYVSGVRNDDTFVKIINSFKFK